MPPARKNTTPAAQPAATEPTAEPTPEPTPAEQPAALFSRTLANALPFYIGHTDNNGVKLATKDRREWAATIGELVGATLAGIVLYTGPARPRTATKADEWSRLNTGDGLEKAVIRAWYGSLHRLDAAERHAAGCQAMGWKTTDAVARYQPTRDDLAAMDAAADPLAELVKLASAIKTATASADGLTREERTTLDSTLRPVIKGALKGGTKWGGTVSGLTDDYTQDQILASITRLTKDNPQAAGLVSTMRATLTALAAAKAKAIEESKAAKAAAAKAAADDAKADADADETDAS